MKNIFVALIVFISGVTASAESFDACYTESRKNYYSIKDSAEICKGLVGDTCYLETRKLGGLNIKDAAELCRNVISDACYIDARKMSYSIRDASNICRGLINSACYQESRKNLFNIKDSTQICRSVVVCQGRN